MIYWVARMVFYRLPGSVMGHLLKKSLPIGLRRFLIERLNRSLVAGHVRSRVDDKTVLLADFPRCGVNWLRFLLATVLHHERTGEFRKLSFKEMYEYAPTIASSGQHSPYRFGDGTNLLKTHTRYYPAFKRGIVIYRDPYEAMKSLCAIIEWREGKIDIIPIESLSPLQTFLVHWAAEFVSIHESWIKAISMTPNNFLVIRYEDMCRDPTPFIPQICCFLNLDISAWNEERIRELGRMYTRRHANWTSDEMVDFRNKRFKELDSDISAEALRRIDPGLEMRVRETLQRMDELRFRPHGDVMRPIIKAADATA